MDFIYELYQNDNFTIYLTIALVVLIILFVVVLLFGKRDQKLEETKKLQKIEAEGFKEEVKEPEKVEVAEPVEVKKVEEVPVLVEVNENIADEEVNVTTFSPDIKPVAEEPIKIELSKEEIELEPELNISDIDLEKDLKELENIKKEFNEIEIPKSTEEVKKTNNDVFSSVFVKKEEEKPTSNVEVVVEPVKEKPNLVTIDDDEEIELPTLKKRENAAPVDETNEKEEPLISEEKEKPFSFDDISGESYKIK